ncbi:MAG: tetratricopeptide repeat protein [Acidobacteriota bacterium]
MHSPNPFPRSRMHPTTLLLAALFVICGLTACSGNSAAGGGGVQGLVVTPDDQLDFGVDMAQRQLWSEALFRFQQASKKDPTNPRIFNNLAVAAEAVGDFEQALEYYREALRLAPSDREIRGNYARFVEFYRAFRPEDPEEGEAEAEEDGGS